MKNVVRASIAALAIMTVSTVAFAQGSGDASGEGVSPNGSAPAGGPGPGGTATSGGGSVSGGGANAVDVMRTSPPGATNQNKSQ